VSTVIPQSPLTPVVLGVPPVSDEVAPPTPELPMLVTGPNPVLVVVGPALPVGPATPVPVVPTVPLFVLVPVVGPLPKLVAVPVTVVLLDEVGDPIDVGDP